MSFLLNKKGVLAKNFKSSIKPYFNLVLILIFKICNSTKLSL